MLSQTKDTYPMNKHDVQTNPDKHIDQDFPDYPHAPAKENLIKPKTKTDKLTAGVTKKDESKTPTGTNTQHHINEISSDGSASAFSAAEGGIDEEPKQQKNENNY